MTLSTPLWLQDGTYTAQADRALIAAAFKTDGVVGAADLRVSQRGAGANRSVDVAAGSAIVNGTNTAGQGPYVVSSDAVVNVPIATAPGTGQSRIDLIVATVRDDGTNDDWILQAIEGVPTTGTPTAPATPASSLALAQVLVGANVTTIVTANITDLRVYAAGSSAAYGANNGSVATRSGTYAGQDVKMQYGIFSGTTNATTGAISATFPKAFPNGCLGVIVIPQGNNPIDIVSIASLSNSGFTASVFRATHGGGGGSIDILLGVPVGYAYIAFGF